MKKGIFEEIKIFTPNSYQDFQGELYTTWCKQDFLDNLGVDLEFVHDKVSVSRRNVLRGIHGDFKSWKYMTCTYGEVYYVVVDNRVDSPTYKKWDWELLSSKNRKTILIPPGFGCSFYVLSDTSVVNYKWAYSGDYPDVSDQFTIPWDDNEIGIHWPTKQPVISERDRGVNV